MCSKLAMVFIFKSKVMNSVIGVSQKSKVMGSVIGMSQKSKVSTFTVSELRGEHLKIAQHSLLP